MPPSAPRVHIESYGCAFNVSDGEVMAGLLEAAGYRMVDRLEQADAVIVNSCTVKDQTLRDLRRRLAPHVDGRASGQVVILAGCVPRVPQHAREFPMLSQLGPDHVGGIVRVVQEALAGRRVVQSSRREDAGRLRLPFRRRNPAVEILPINKGCLGSCTFCQTVLARGRLVSFPADEIVERVERAVAEGVRIVWLTSQDYGAYGMDRGDSLPALLERIAREPGDFKVRLGMANPDHIKLFADELAEVLGHPKFFRFAHIPLQSGSNAVLGAMKREYTVEQFRDIVRTLRERVPDVTIASDMIVGYPTETERDFEASVRLVEELGIPVLNRSKFSSRPGTPAARLAPLPSAVVSARSRRLYDVHARLAARLHGLRVGGAEECHVEATLRPGRVLARTRSYEPVVVETGAPPGHLLHVMLCGAERFHLRGVEADPPCTVVPAGSRLPAAG